MSAIQYIRKPEEITYDEIFDLVYAAHDGNRKQGLVINPGMRSGADFEKHLGDRSLCMVAMDGDRMVGTMSVRIEQGTRRLTKNMLTGYMMNLAVNEEYRGRGIGSELMNRLCDYAAGEGAKAAVFYVVARNKAVKLYKELGFIEADFLARRTLKQNSIYMLKWLGKPGYPDWAVKLYYTVRKVYLTQRYGFQ